MRDWLNEHFGFTKREYNGLLVLMAILLLLTSLPYFYKADPDGEAKPTIDEQAAIQQLVLAHEDQNVYKHARNDGKADERTPVVYFNFDPNQLNLTQWQKLGLSAKQAQSILNYTAKGGKFYKPTDLKKMYAISQGKYAQLEAYIRIDKNRFETQFKRSENIVSGPKKYPMIEINAADTNQLDQIKGIGIAFAKRIVAYRERLGGFYQKEQLREVFGLDSAKYTEIEAQVAVDAALIRKIAINTADFSTLKNNPYLNFKQINAILQFRKQHGNYNSLDDLKKVIILTPKNIQNLAPYLIFDDRNKN